MSTSWRMPVSGDGLQRAFQPCHHLARPAPAAGLIEEAREGAQLRLAAERMMEAQMGRGLGHQRIKRGIAGEPENVVGIIVFRPVHGLGAAVMAIAGAPNTGLLPLTAVPAGPMFDEG